MNRFVFALVSGLVLVLDLSISQAALYPPYYGNAYDSENPGFGGVVAGGWLDVSANSTRVSITFHKGNGSFQDNLVFFIDSVAGGVGSTRGFTDCSDALRTSVSGYYINWQNVARRSTANFASGFQADYAIALGVNGPNAGTLYQIIGNENASTLVEPKPVGLNPNSDPGSATYTLNFNWADIGLMPGSGNGFRFESTYITSTGSRSLESFEKFTPESRNGYNSVTFQNYDVYGVAPIPETANAALAIFAGLVITSGLATRAWRCLVRSPWQSRV
jgi:hypothetical protein